MTGRALPEPWASAAGACGVRSVTALALRSHLSVETVRRLVWQVGQPSEQTLRNVAAALNREVTVVAAWAGVPRTLNEPWVPPDEAHHLTQQQRRALDALIRSMTQSQISDSPHREDTE